MFVRQTFPIIILSSCEHRTLKLCAVMTRMSAGSRSPNLTSTISPTTNSSALRFNCFSPLVTKAYCKMMPGKRIRLFVLTILTHGRHQSSTHSSNVPVEYFSINNLIRRGIVTHILSIHVFVVLQRRLCAL